MKTKETYLVFAALLLSLIVTSPVLATKPKLVIGANLIEYKQPNKPFCDVLVPSQYSSIQDGVNAATSGEIICVAAGTYHENVTINKPVRLSGKEARNSKSTIIGEVADYTGALRIEANNVTVEGFEIIGVGTDYSSATLRISESVSDAVIQYNHIIAGKGELALLTDGFQNNHAIKNNILEGNDSPQVVLVNGEPSVSKPSNQVNIINNTFIGTVNPTTRQDTGTILVQHATDSSINFNVFNTSGVVNEVIQNAYASAISRVNYNNFNSVAQLWKISNGAGILNAENNWWGDTDPSDDVRNDMVNFTPYSSSPFIEN